MLFSTLLLIFSTLFVLTTVAMASDAELLQPASTITYNEDLIVNGTGRFSSVYIGQTGIGGVTFFNGTIINTGEYDPVTFGDDVRIDGELWRGTSKGVGDNMPIKVSDAMVPTLDDINDLGWPEKRWQNIYYSQNLIGNNVNLNGNLTLQPAGSSPDTYIKISAVNDMNLGFTPNDSFNGLLHTASDKGIEIGLGDYQTKILSDQGHAINFTGITGYDKNNENVLMLGFSEDQVNGDRYTILTAGNTEGSYDGELYIMSAHLDSLREARFKNRDDHDLTVVSGECRYGNKQFEDGTLVRGDYDVDPAGTGLYYCEGGWHALY